MTEEEICRSYRQAHSPSKQIKVLAELNCCKDSDIKQILKDNGYMKKQGRPSAEPEKPLSKAERLLKAVNEQAKMDRAILTKEGLIHNSANEPKLTLVIPEAVRIALENQIMALNKQINDLQAQRGEIEHFLGWDEVEKHLEERLV